MGREGSLSKFYEEWDNLGLGLTIDRLAGLQRLVEESDRDELHVELGG